MKRGVVDTNIPVSGLRVATGHEARVVLAIHIGLLVPIFSPDILDEYADVLARPKFRYPPAVVAGLLDLFRSRGELIGDTGTFADGPDPADYKFMACAIAGRADFLVTGNRRDFPLPYYGAAQVVSAREVLGRIASTG